MYCPKCGTLNTENVTQCANCNQPLQAGVQPQSPMYNNQAPVPDVPSRLVPAILATLFCCLPFGIVAIVYAAQVKSKASAGDYNGAMDSSRKATTWCWVAFGLGLAVVLIQIVLMVIGGGLSAASQY